jgi:hypothetical protein
MVDATAPDEAEWALQGRMTIEERTARDRALLDVSVPALIWVVQARRTATRLKLQAQTPVAQQAQTLVAQYAPGCQVGVAAAQQVTAAGDQSQPHRVSAEVQGELELKWFDLWDQPQPDG